MIKYYIGIILSAVQLVCFSEVKGQSPRTTPKQLLGHNFGDPGWLANYSEIMQYWQQVEKESDRIKVVRIGTSSMGKPMYMAIISAAENLKKLEYYRNISKQLALAENINAATAEKLSASGKAVIWIDGGLHGGNETQAAQQIGKFVEELTTRNDEEAQRIRRDVITLVVPANPDGMELVPNWYRQHPETGGRHHPGLWHKYIEHDNNRDFYMASQLETIAMDSILYRAWFPQIVYNHHTGGGTQNIGSFLVKQNSFQNDQGFPTLLMQQADMVINAILLRFKQQGQFGMESESQLSASGNGLLSTTPSYHNMIGIISEIGGGPQGTKISNQFLELKSAQSPLPYSWHDSLFSFSATMAYDITANFGLLDFASRYRKELLYNIYKMGKTSIEAGNKDHWSLTQDKIIKISVARKTAFQSNSSFDVKEERKMFYTVENRDPRAYIIPFDQPHYLTAIKFINTLIKTGIKVCQATSDFNINGKKYSKGSFIVQTAQAFRPHILDMFEPQLNEVHNSFYADPGGYTLAFQMGIEFDRMLDKVEGPFKDIKGYAVPMQHVVSAEPLIIGYTWPCNDNDAFYAVQQILRSGLNVYRLEDGTFFVKNSIHPAKKILDKVSQELGIKFTGCTEHPRNLHEINTPRIAIVESYWESMEAGWYRFIFDQHSIPYSVIGPEALESNALNERFDIIIITSGRSRYPMFTDNLNRTPMLSFIPDDYRHRFYPARKSIAFASIQGFMRAGGKVLVANKENATLFVDAFKLPGLANADLPKGEKEYEQIPWIQPMLQLQLDNSSPLTKGYKEKLKLVYSANSCVFILSTSSATIKKIAWIDAEQPISSGDGPALNFIHSQEAKKRLNETAVVIEANIGKGKLILYGMDPNYRGQSHAAFKLFLNALYE